MFIIIITITYFNKSSLVPDGLSPRFLKECVSVFPEPLHFILLTNHYQQVNCCIRGIIAYITPLFKKCGKSDKNNYRQISLRSLVCKLTGKIVKSRAMEFWRNIHILFRTGLVRWRADPHFLSFFPAMTIGLNDATAESQLTLPSKIFLHRLIAYHASALFLSKSVNWYWRLSSSVVSHLFNWPHAAICPAWYMLVLVSYFIGSSPGNNSRTVGISVIVCFLLKPTSIRRTHPIKSTSTPKWMLFWQFIYCFKPLFSRHLNNTFFRLQVYEGVGISLVEVYMYERVEKSVIWVCERAQKANRWLLWLFKVAKTFYFCGWLLFKRQCIYSS